MEERKISCTNVSAEAPDVGNGLPPNADEMCTNLSSFSRIFLSRYAEKENINPEVSPRKNISNMLSFSSLSPKKIPMDTTKQFFTNTHPVLCKSQSSQYPTHPPLKPIYKRALSSNDTEKVNQIVTTKRGYKFIRTNSQNSSLNMQPKFNREAHIKKSEFESDHNSGDRWKRKRTKSHIAPENSIFVPICSSLFNSNSSSASSFSFSNQDQQINSIRPSSLFKSVSPAPSTSFSILAPITSPLTPSRSNFHSSHNISRSISNSNSSSPSSILNHDISVNTSFDICIDNHILPICNLDGPIKRVSIQTVATLLKPEKANKNDRIWLNQVKKYIIIDCRYNYEFLGGHIKGAINIMSKRELHNFFRDQFLEDFSRTVVILHCEYSKARGPKAATTVRQIDRDNNTYPHLNFPELYVLEGGYRKFYHNHPDLCTPCNYVSMFNKKFKDEFKTENIKYHHSWYESKVKRSKTRCYGTTRTLTPSMEKKSRENRTKGKENHQKKKSISPQKFNLEGTLGDAIFSPIRSLSLADPSSTPDRLKKLVNKKDFFP